MKRRVNPVTLARAQGYIRRPLGYQGVNDAWVCSKCGAIRKTATALMKRHGSCTEQYALALISACRSRD
jgi:hypothetical protein